MKPDFQPLFESIQGNKHMPTATTIKIQERLLQQEFVSMYELARDVYLCLVFIAQLNVMLEVGLEEIETTLKQLAAFKALID